jgi:hypothetical protein
VWGQKKGTEREVPPNELYNINSASQYSIIAASKQSTNEIVLLILPLPHPIDKRKKQYKRKQEQAQTI